MQGEMPMRPRSIVLFEQLYLVAIAIEVGRTVFDWPLLVQSTAADIGVRLATILVSLLLVFLAARRRRRFAALILAALFFIGLPMVATVLRPGLPLETAAVIALQVLLQAVALVQLARPASRAWLADGPAAEAADPSSRS